jgi:hypothetical protein
MLSSNMALTTYRSSPSLCRFIRPSHLAWMLMLLAVGCSKTSGGNALSPDDMLDSAGVPNRWVADHYDRGSTIRIDFLKLLTPDGDFEPGEIALLKQALDTLTQAEIIALGVTQLFPGTATSVAGTNFMRFDNKIYISMAGGPSPTRPLDPDLGDKFLAFIGHPDRHVAPASRRSQ